MDKVRWVYPSLVGQDVLLEESKRYCIEGIVSRSSRFRLVAQDGQKRDVDEEVAFRGFLRTLAGAKEPEDKAELTQELKEFIFKFVLRCDELLQRSKSLRKDRRRLRSKVRENEKLKARHQEQEDKRGNVLGECQDKYTLPSIEREIDRALDSIVVVDRKLKEVQDQMSETFGSKKEISEFFQSLGVPVSLRSLHRWSKTGRVGGEPGRPPAFSKETEDRLADLVVLMDQRGFPMSRVDVLEAAREMAEGTAVDERFSEDGPTMDWLDLWLTRVKTRRPELVQAVQRGSDCRFNSDHVNHLFNKLKDLALRLRFARQPEEGEKGEITWLTPERVLFTDETCVSEGAHMQKGPTSKRNVITSEANLEKNSKVGKYRRRTAVKENATEGQITLVAGHNLVGEVSVPIWIFGAQNYIQKSSVEKIKEVVPKCPAYNCVNEQNVTDVVIGTSAGGGITTTDLTPLMERVIRLMFPDVEDKPGKRVLWLTDWHKSRLSSTLLQKLTELGVYLFRWVPNITSKMQSLDVALFRVFKAKLQELTERWTVRHFGERLDRTIRVQLAGKALIESFTVERIMKGCREMGMLPFDRQALLQHPSINDGNAFAVTRKELFANETLRTLQTTPVETKPSSSSSSSSQEALLTPPTTPQQEESSKILPSPSQGSEISSVAETTFTSISLRKPSFGPFRQMCEDISSRASFEAVRARLIKNARNLVMSRELDWDVDAKAKDVGAKRLKRLKYMEDEARALLRDIKDERTRVSEWIAKVRDTRLREIATYKKWKEKLEDLGPDDVDVLAMLAEKQDQVVSARRDEFGLVVDENEDTSLFDTALSDARSSPMKRFLAQRLASSSEASTGARKRAKTTTFKPGSLANRFGYHQTGPETLEEVCRYESAAVKAVVKQAEALQTKEEKREKAINSMPERLARLACAIREKRALCKPCTGECREFLKVLAQKAKLENDENLKAKVDAVKGLKRQELMDSVFPLLDSIQ